MKDYKIILISFVLLIFMIGAVSAASNEETTVGDIPIIIDPGDIPIIIDPDDSGNQGDDNPTESNDIKDIYVNDTGDDSNVGSAESPYATIGRAIDDINESQRATIYLSEGTFASDNDSNIILELNQKFNGGSLTIIGAGIDKTYIDGQSAFNFATFYSNTNITLKDISFINFKSNQGGIINGFGGILNQ